ncbi:hypothetical protein ACFL4H_00160 [Candidatus Neomarinimicrobiota bacterium]
MKRYSVYNNEMIEHPKGDWLKLSKVKLLLEEIAKGEGPYSLEPLRHAENTIESMKDFAKEALKEIT